MQIYLKYTRNTYTHSNHTGIGLNAAERQKEETRYSDNDTIELMH